MEPNPNSEDMNDAETTLPISYQLGDRVYKTDLYLENYIVKIEIYKPKDKTRRPTLATINRIFRRLGDVRVLPKDNSEAN